MKEQIKSESGKTTEYMGIGRRKSSSAEVFIKPGQGSITINQQPCETYLQKNTHLVLKINQPLEFLGKEVEPLDITVMVQGGGLVAQSEAIRLGLARALYYFNDEWRPVLKSAGYLRRDARIKERKKYGLKKARKAPQYSKR